MSMSNCQWRKHFQIPIVRINACYSCSYLSFIPSIEFIVSSNCPQSPWKWGTPNWSCLRPLQHNSGFVYVLRGGLGTIMSRLVLSCPALSAFSSLNFLTPDGDGGTYLMFILAILKLSRDRSWEAPEMSVERGVERQRHCQSLRYNILIPLNLICIGNGNAYDVILSAMIYANQLIDNCYYARHLLYVSYFMVLIPQSAAGSNQRMIVQCFEIWTEYPYCNLQCLYI